MPLSFFESDWQSTLAEEPVFWFDDIAFCSNSCIRAYDEPESYSKGGFVIA